ncbi:MAG: cobalamin-dependent protein [Ignavibacteria bacterium]
MSALKYLLISPGKPRTIAQTLSPAISLNAFFPVGLAYVSAAMKNAGFETYTINSNFLESDIESALTNIIMKNDIGVVCTGGQSIDVHEIIYIINIVRRINSKIKIIVGGAIISSDPETAMNVLGADIGVIGEGEETMCELAFALNSDKFIGDVPGIIFWQNGLLKQSCERPEIANMNNLPLMDFDGFAYSQWLEIMGYAGIIYSARSCPFQCTFCFKSTGNKYR